MNYSIPIPTMLRDKACVLAKEDYSAAADLARTITDPWFRTQALASASFYAPDEHVLSLAMEAFSVAATSDDLYKVVAVSAWPLSAMLERGYVAETAYELERLLNIAPHIEPESSRSEAICHLFEVLYPMGDAVRIQIIDILFELANNASAHWRTKRNLLYALAILVNDNADYAHALAEKILNEKTRTKIKKAMSLSQNFRPRRYID